MKEGRLINWLRLKLTIPLHPVFTLRNHQLMFAKSLKLGAAASLLIFAATANAEVSVMPGYQIELLHEGAPFESITGLIVNSEGDLLLTDAGFSPTRRGGLFEFDPETKSYSTLNLGLPLSQPMSMVSGAANGAFDFDAIIVDADSEFTSDCCIGRVLGYNQTLDQYTTLSTKSPICTSGGPFDIALPPSNSLFPQSLYVLERTCSPHIYRVNPDLMTEFHYFNPTEWPENPIRVISMVFSNTVSFGDYLYILTWHDGGNIQRLSPTDELTKFLEDDMLGTYRDFVFSNSAAFGNYIYLVTASNAETGQVQVFRIDPSGNPQAFVAGLPPHPEPVHWLAAARIGFDETENTLYIAYADRIYSVTPTSLADPGTVTVDSITTNQENQIVINYTLTPHDPPTENGYTITTLAFKTTEDCTDVSGIPDGDLDDISQYVTGDITVPSTGGVGTIVWDVQNTADTTLQEKYYKANLSVLFRLRADLVE